MIAERVLTTTEREVSEPDTLPRRRFTVEEYEQLVQVGILADDERVELLEGELIEMSPINLSHVLAAVSYTHLTLPTSDLV